MVFPSREIKTKKTNRNSRIKNYISEIKKEKSLNGINIRLENFRRIEIMFSKEYSDLKETEKREQSLVICIDQYKTLLIHV